MTTTTTRTSVRYLYYPNRTLSGNTDMIAIPFVYLWVYERARVYATLGTYQNRRPPCTGNRDDTVIIFSDKPTIPPPSDLPPRLLISAPILAQTVNCLIH